MFEARTVTVIPDSDRNRMFNRCYQTERYIVVTTKDCTERLSYELMDQLTAGVRSGLSYSGARNIPELWNKAKFIQVTREGYRESLPHDVKPL